MRRLLSIVLLLSVLVMSSVAFANYPRYLNGDENFILIDGHMGTGWYVDRTSLEVQDYDPPQYIIAVNVISARSAIDDEKDFYNGGMGVITGVSTKRFFYNWDSRQMYIDRDGNSDWRYLDPNGSWAETGIAMPAGEMAFALAYGLKFYGGKQFYNTFLHKMTCPFSDSFYSAI